MSDQGKRRGDRSVGSRGGTNQAPVRRVRCYLGEMKSYMKEWERLKSKASRGLPLTPDEVTFVREMTLEFGEPEEEEFN